MMRTLKRLGCNRVAVINDEKVYSQGLAAAAVRESNAVGMQVVFERAHPPTTDYGTLADAIMTANPEAVFYAGYEPEFTRLVRTLRQKGFVGLLSSGDGSRVSGIGARIGAPAAEGILLTCPCPDINKSTEATAKRFVSDFKAKFNKNPGAFAAEGYDVANLAIAAIEDCGEGGAASVTRGCVVERVREGGFEGVTKRFDFAPNGELRTGDVVLYVIRDGELKEVGLAGELPPVQP